jgi:hypothetical protein
MMRTSDDSGENLTVSIKVDLDYDKTNLKEFETSIVDALEHKGVDPSYISKISFEKGLLFVLSIGSVIAKIECLDKNTFLEVNDVFKKGTPIEFEDQELRAEVLDDDSNNNGDD